jgi:hypothetical protein
MITAVYNALAGDATLLAQLSGGVYNAVTAHEISRQNTPAAYDANGELLPCCLVTQESATPWGEIYHAGRLYILLYFYQRYGYDSIETARKRVYALLDRQVLTPTDGSGCYRIDHATDILGSEDQGLGAAMQVSRYMAMIQRG